MIHMVITMVTEDPVSKPIQTTKPTPHDYGDDPAQTLSSLAPPLPYHSHISSPPPSESPATLDESEHNLSSGILSETCGGIMYSSSSEMVRMVISTDRPPYMEEGEEEWEEERGEEGSLGPYATSGKTQRALGAPEGSGMGTGRTYLGKMGKPPGKDPPKTLMLCT